ncbi:MAG: hypothetical protein M1575_00460 [Patescibacteria group bacterium]|nr:hypothetical protein [Patescibacteria group bacterium]MCL5095198.1 hypothetical protein [Patescibacteria group bacterium]
MKQKLGLFILLFILIFNFFFRIFEYRQEYLTKFDPVYWQNRYLKSQWVDPQSKESIGDDGLYAYAGWAYVNGEDPSILNAEMPPLGKYLIGLSIIIFQNQNIFALLTGILVLFCFYKLNLFFLKDKFWSLLPVTFFSFEPLFYKQLRAPYLDTLYLMFLILTFYFLLKEKFFLFAVCFGLMAGTKNTVSTGLLVGATCGLYLFVSKRKNLINFLRSLPLAIIVFLLTYGRYFFLGHSFREFLGVQKWILNFYTVGAKGEMGMVFPMMILNRWPTWWDGVVNISEWQITWPILFIAGSWYLVSHLLKRKRDSLSLIVIWLVIYFVFLFFIPVWPRYFLLIMPFLYLFLTYLVKEKFSNIIVKTK